MAGEKFRIIGGKRRSEDSNEGTKRKRILEDSEDEVDTDDDEESEAESEASAFTAGDDGEEDEEEDDTLMVTDEEDEMLARKKGGKNVDDKISTRRPKRLKVTRVDDKASATPPVGVSAPTPCSDDSNHSTDEKPPEISSEVAAASPNNFFSDFASNVSTSARESLTPRVADKGDLERKVTPSPMPIRNLSYGDSHSTNVVDNSDWKRPSIPVDGSVNPAGTHWHNHFHFLRFPRDVKGRSPDDPNYDARTLRVDLKEILKVTNSPKIPAAKQQWWELKSRYADTLLLFKVGKFYEIFHQDCDIATRILGIEYMKGPEAHCGFPESSYGYHSSGLVKAGYKVARVEQTESATAFKDRQKQTPRGKKKPQVMNREVCSVMSAGTRTFCYMDDIRCFDQEEGEGVGPLLAIKEVPFDQSERIKTNQDEVRPVCEFGVAVVDAVRGTVTLGQFADDILMSRMGTLLTKFAPSEVSDEN